MKNELNRYLVSVATVAALAAAVAAGGARGGTARILPIDPTAPQGTVQLRWGEGTRPTFIPAPQPSTRVVRHSGQIVELHWGDGRPPRYVAVQPS
jgi:hypothetical protein